jgi:hypothetical protein
MHMPEPNHFFDPLQSRVLKWTLVALAVVTSIMLVTLLIVGIVYNFSELRHEIAQHLIVIIGLAGMGMASILLIGICRYQDGPMEVEGITFKFKGGAGPVILWIMAFLAMIVGSKMLWVLN